MNDKNSNEELLSDDEMRHLMENKLSETTTKKAAILYI